MFLLRLGLQCRGVVFIMIVVIVLQGLIHQKAYMIYYFRLQSSLFYGFWEGLAGERRSTRFGELLGSEGFYLSKDFKEFKRKPFRSVLDLVDGRGRGLVLGLEFGLVVYFLFGWVIYYFLCWNSPVFLVVFGGLYPFLGRA